MAIVYAGFLDIADPTPIDWTRIKAASLFFEGIAVFDAYFLSRGKIFNHLFDDLYGAQPHFAGPDHVQNRLKVNNVAECLRLGLFRPCLRHGTSLGDVWFNGSNFGFNRAQYLAATAEQGNFIFEKLTNPPEFVIPWTTGMRDATINDFALKVNEEFSRDSIEEIEELLRQSEQFLDPSRVGECEKAIELVHTIFEQAQSNRENTRYRRGMVEEQIKIFCGLEAFSYAKFLNNKPNNCVDLVAAEILRTVSGVYHAYHCENFGIKVVASSSSNDRLAIREYEEKTKIKSFVDYELSLLQEIDVSKLTIQEVHLIRLTSEFSDICALVDSAINRSSADAVFKLGDYCENKYSPKIREMFPQCQRDISGLLKTSERLSTISNFVNVATAGGQLLLSVAGITLLPIISWIKPTYDAVTTGNSAVKLTPLKYKRRYLIDPLANIVRRQAVDAIVKKKTANTEDER